MTPPMLLLAQAHLPLTALAIVTGLAVAAASRDLMKRLLGAGAAMLAATAHLAVAARGDGVQLGAIVLALAGMALGLVVLVRIREGFGGVAAVQVRAGIDEDMAQAEREA